MDLRNRAFRNYNEEDAFENINLGLPPFLLGGTMTGSEGTSSTVTTVGTTSGNTVTTAASMNTQDQDLEECDDLLTFNKDDYRNLQTNNPHRFHELTDRFLREMQRDVSHLELNDKSDETMLANKNICEQINMHLKVLLEVLDQIPEGVSNDANSSFTDFKVRFEVVISMTEALVAKYKQSGQKATSGLSRRLTRCATTKQHQEIRTSSRVQNMCDHQQARLSNQTITNFSVLGQQPRLAGNTAPMNLGAQGNSFQPESEARPPGHTPFINHGSQGNSFQRESDPRLSGIPPFYQGDQGNSFHHEGQQRYSGGQPFMNHGAEGNRYHSEHRGNNDRRQQFHTHEDEDRGSMSSANSIIETLSDLTFDGSWRLTEYNGSDLAAITIHSAMMQIALITRTEVSQFTDECVLKALDARDIPQLKDWQKIINKNIHKLPSKPEFKDLQIYAGHALKAAFKYIATVDRLIRERGLHIKSDNTTASPLELKRFDGYESKDTNVFEFLTQLMLVCKGMQQNEVAEYLFCNYITKRLQNELNHIRHSFPDMKMFLLKKYGRINRLLRENKQKLRDIIPPNSKTSKPAKIQYLNHVLETLQQVKSLVDHNKNDRPGIEHEVFNYDTIMEFVSNIAEPYKSGYIGEYVKVSSTSYGDEDLPGALIFNLLLKYIKGQVRKIELSIETSILPNQEIDKKPLQTRSINTLEIEEFEADSETDENIKPVQINVTSMHSMNDKPANSKKKWSDDGKWHQATCFMHDATYQRVKECRMGLCSTFLNAAPKERLKRAEEKSRCKLCFMRKCNTKSPNNCMFKESIGQSLRCKACLVQGNHINILVCEHHDSSAIVAKNELVSFLAGYEVDMSINLMTLSILKLSKEKAGKSITTEQSRKNDLVYNVSDGTSMKKQEILHKISKDQGLDCPLFLLQTLNVGGQAILCMFDTGAGGEVCTTDLAEKLKLEVLDPRDQFIRVASGKVVPTGGCVYRATLGPDPDDIYHEVSLTGMSKITGNINHYNLAEIIKEFKINQSSTPLSKECFPPHVGGSEVGLLIGVKQSCLMPDLLMVLPSGISVWRSRFRDIHGSSIMFSGLHESISSQAKTLNPETIAMNIMFSQEASYYLYEAHENVNVSSNGINIAPQILQFEDGKNEFVDVCICSKQYNETVLQCYCFKDVSDELLECNDYSDELEDKDPAYLMKFKIKSNKVTTKIEQDLFEQEDIGAKVDYRCPQCQGCLRCKTERRTRDISIKEIAEEQLIKASVKVDTSTNSTYAKYPFIKDPVPYLKEKWNGRDNNYFMAIRTLNSVRNKTKVEKDGIIKFHNELLAKNYAIKVSDLPVKVQEDIHNAPLRHYFPWKGVQKPGSSSTKHRMVTDPSITDFNSVLAKGINCMNSLFEIVVEWRTFLYSATSDISKMFNSLRLEESEYKYSLYLFSPNLELDETPELHAMTTIMYGLKCAGNQCTSALREVADEFKDECPRANRILHKSTFMDDSGFGSNSKEDLNEIINEIKTVLPRGGFQIKAVNLSGETPHESTSSDGINSQFAGYQWSQKLDLLSLNHGDINFHKKIRGTKKPNEFTINNDDDVDTLVKTQKFTRRILMGKTLEVYDLCGIAEPLKAKLKLDVRKLVDLDFDSTIPANLRESWISNLKLIQNSKNLTWQRSVVPENAVNPDEFELVCFVDAAMSMTGTCIYTRFLCKDGYYHSQLLTARSKCSSSTIPRNELCSALLGAQTLHIVMNRLGSRVKDYIVLTDSEICLFWITNTENRLKSYVFNRVQNIHRLLDKEQFYHVRTLDNSADLLTRGEIELEDLDKGSPWQNGPDWLRLPVDQMPLRSPDNIRKLLTKEQEAHISRESQPKLADEKILPSLNQMSASFSSSGNICCHQFDISADCHCFEETKCCLCIYDPLLLEDDMEYPNFNTKLIPSQEPFVLHLNHVKRNMLDDIIGLQYYGFQKSIRLLGLLFRFITRKIHQSHEKKGVTNHKCRLCNSDNTVKRNAMHTLTVKNQFIPTSYEIHLAWDFICRQASDEVRANVSSKKLLAYEEENGVLVSGGRLSYPDVLVDSPELPYLPDMNYKSPVALVKSNLVVSLAIYIHWYVLPHVGIEQQLSFMLKIVHVENLRFLIKKVRNECTRCKYLVKRSPVASTGNQTRLAMLKVPAFYAAMIDICGPFDAFTLIRQVRDKRTRKAYMLVFVCLTSSATNIHCLEDMTTESIVSAILRHSNRYGVAQFLLADNQSSFHVLDQARVQIQDLQGKLWKNKRIILDYSTPLHHAGHGKVEVRVKLIREMLNTTSESSKEHSYLMWETVGSTISNMLNNMPIAHCSDRNGIDDPIFLVTPNSLLLGKNQNRSVSGPIELEDCYVSNQFTNVNEITELVQSNIARMAHKYVPGRKVCISSPPLIGEIILFVMKESERSRNIQMKYGRVVENYVDGRENKIRIKYKNSTEIVFREVCRHVNEIVVILSLQDLKFDTMHEQLLNELQMKHL